MGEKEGYQKGIGRGRRESERWQSVGGGGGRGKEKMRDNRT